MRFSKIQWLHWLATNGKTLTRVEMERARELLDEAERNIDYREAQIRDALEHVQQVAKSIGLESAADLLKMASAPTPPLATQETGGPHSGPRKPFLDPFDPQSEAYALPRRYPAPEPLARLMKQEKQPWTREELHYKNHATAMRARGLKPLYDAAKRHAELMALEQSGGPRRG